MNEIERVSISDFERKLFEARLTPYCLAYFLGDKFRTEEPNVLRTREKFALRFHEYMQLGFIEFPYYILIDEVSDTINYYVDMYMKKAMLFSRTTLYLVDFIEPNEYYNYYQPLNNMLSFEAFREVNSRLMSEGILRNMNVKYRVFNLERYRLHCEFYLDSHDAVYRDNDNVIQDWVYVDPEHRDSTL